jgi:hypothetical protein
MFSKRKTCAIPQQWLLDVVEKLKRGSNSEIEWTDQAFDRWHFYGTRSEAYHAMLKALVPGVIGKLVKMPIDEGPTYAFFFTAKNKQMYGKICLTHDGRLIIIFSAHDKEKDEL